MDRKAVKVVKRFIRKVSKYLKVEKAILFGSRVRDEWLEDSDIDLIVVSPVNGIHFTDRAILLYRLWNDNYPLEVLCYTPEEFKKKIRQIGIVKEAVREGIVL